MKRITLMFVSLFMIVTFTSTIGVCEEKTVVPGDCYFNLPIESGRTFMLDSNGKVANLDVFGLALPTTSKIFAYTNGMALAEEGWYLKEIGDSGNGIGPFDDVSVFAGGYGTCMKGGVGYIVDEKMQIRKVGKCDGISPFVNGLARVHKGQKVGFVDVNGALVIPESFGIPENDLARYSLPGLFAGGYALVSRDNENVFINTYGKELDTGEAIPSGHFGSGLGVIMLENQSWGFVNGNGIVVFDGFKKAHPFSNGLAFVEMANGQQAFIDPGGEIVFELSTGLEPCGLFSCGLVRVYDTVAKEYLFLDTSGEDVGVRATEAQDFAFGFASISTSNRPLVITRKGETCADGAALYTQYVESDCCTKYLSQTEISVRVPVITGEWLSYELNALISERRIMRLSGELTGYLKTGFREGLATCAAGPKTMVCTLSGEVVGSKSFLHIGEFSEGLAPALDAGTKLWGYINRSAEYAIPPQFKAAFPFMDGYAVCVKDSDIGTSVLIDKTVRPVFIAEQGQEISPSRGGIWPVGTLWQHDIESGYPFSDRTVHKYSEMVFVDMHGDKVDLFDSKVLEASGFFEGLGFVRFEGSKKYSLVTVDGDVLKRDQYLDCRKFSEGYCAVKEGTEWFYIDSSGKALEVGGFDGAREFHNGVAAVRTGKNWGLISSKGKLIAPAIFRRILY